MGPRSYTGIFANILGLVVQEVAEEHKLRPVTGSSSPPCLQVSGGRRRHVLTDSLAERLSVGKGAFTASVKLTAASR